MSDRPAVPPILRMSGIGKSFGATQALDGVDLELGRGEVHALIGENGAGKSTMMKILSGAIVPDAGRMEIDGRPYAPSGPGDGLRGGVSMIYQELNLAPHLSVAENIMLGRETARSGWLDRPAIRRQVREVLELVRHPEISPDVPVGRLSVGAKQLVEIARALLNKSRILVMDEPTSSLTQEDSQRLFEIIRGLRGQDVGVIYISHFLEEVQSVADSYTVLRDGRSVGSGAMAGTSLDDLIQLMVGRKFTQLFPRVEHACGGPVLTLDRLKGRRMAAPVSLDLAKGEILGLAGLIGSGRTETLRALFGLDEVEGGAVVVSGAELAGRRPWARIGRGLGLLSEDRQGEGLALNLSVADNMTLSRLAPFRRRGLLRPARQRRSVAGLIDRLKIKAKGPGQPVGALSGGNQQKVALGRLLHQEASVLLLDEPTRGIDVVSKSQIYEWIGGLAREGKAILFVSSYLPELLGICDRIAVFHRGNLVESRPAAAWDAAGLMAAATVGRAPRGTPVEQRNAE
ncbi:MAG TPA: sugar ABC transporter ATP-binding protein [Candidatus Aminicenantes bacterium]|nr:sugar ABC transporter ATP-binding protein [Candidatus Aminicenantes bacterium]HRY64684.1 sugar ABC transporter ATP-binding protein [Candidatus Aminicenantes bacterium]HRZ71597.1 sugar ABC transporter ATP-binding protein [Candidatus Aminicenantes bacterium]